MSEYRSVNYQLERLAERHNRIRQLRQEELTLADRSFRNLFMVIRWRTVNPPILLVQPISRRNPELEDATLNPDENAFVGPIYAVTGEGRKLLITDTAEYILAPVFKRFVNREDRQIIRQFFDI